VGLGRLDLAGELDDYFGGEKMDFSGLELLSDVAARRALFRQSVMDIGVGPACADAAGPECADATRPAHADATRSAWVNATKPSRADEKGTAAERRYVYSDTPCADAAGLEYADATRSAHADAARSAYPTRHNAVHVNEREKTEAKPVLMNDPAYDVIDNMMDFYVDRKDATLHKRYSTEDSSRRQLPMINRDVPEELLIEFDGLYSTTNRGPPTDQHYLRQRDDCGLTWGRERTGPYYHDTDNQAERYRAELRARKRQPNELLQSLYHDIARLMSLAYPGQTGVISEVVARDAFLEALDEPQLRIRILERKRKTLEDALHMAYRLEALERGFRTDVLPERGSRTDTPVHRAADEADKRRDRYVRSASDDKPMCQGKQNSPNS